MLAIGTHVYQCDGVRIYEHTIENIIHDREIIYETEAVCFDKRALGYSVFLSRTEAEKHLAV